MEKLNLDFGIKEYQLGDFGMLRFNPTDVNIYDRFMQSLENISAIEQKLIARGAELGERPDGSAIFRLMADMDREVKAELNNAFGNGNDFDKIMGGANLLAVCDNGERLVTNIISALQPIILDGVKRFVNSEVALAKANREQRVAAQPK